MNESQQDRSGKLWEERCFRFGPPQDMQGLWLNEFEGSRFCAAPARECLGGQKALSPADYREHVWLTFRTLPPGLASTAPGGVYSIDFIGRRSLFPGIFGVASTKEVIVDRLISIKQMKPPPPQPTKAQMDAWEKHCEAARQCIPAEKLWGKAVAGKH